MDKKCIFLIICLTLLLAPISDVFAGNRGRGRAVTPYGDFSRRCGQYGTCESPMGPGEAEKAMKDYYNKKGLDVEIEDAKGRFIRAKVKDKEKTVDVIIFDCHTGRVRSIY